MFKISPIFGEITLEGIEDYTENVILETWVELVSNALIFI
jgi:hypothetical protein